MFFKTKRQKQIERIVHAVEFYTVDIMNKTTEVNVSAAITAAIHLGVKLANDQKLDNEFIIDSAREIGALLKTKFEKK